MGQALYRKYRSKSWDEIVGQEHIVSTLKKAIANGQVSHAYLLTGPRGVGKTSVARILAHAVNDLPYNDESAHLDIIEIDAASNNGVENVRDLREKVYVAPTTGKYKVYIIDEVHMLSKAAFNALLKTLEEPPAHVIFILATTESHKLPETIVSRTQRFSFRPIEPAQAVEHLRQIAKAEKIEIDDEALQLIAQHSEGSFRDSLSLLDQVRAISQPVTAEAVRELVGEAPAALLTSIIQALAGQNAVELINILKKLDEQGHEAAVVAKQLTARLRQEMLSGQSSTVPGQTLALLGKLIDVPASREPKIALELALLGSIDSPATVKAVSKPQKAAKAEPQVEQSIERAAAGVPTEPETTAPTSSQNSSDELWAEVLSSIKQQHNTLYGVLRMAKATWGKNELTLAFGFKFHQKRADDAKNRQVIAETIRELTGREIVVNCIVDTTLTKQNVKEEDKPDDPALTSISNIFGGAELLES